MANNDPILDNDFEYNDGLGDLLREKQRLEFNLPKTILVLSSLVGVCIVLVFFFSTFTNKFFLDTPTTTMPATSELLPPKTDTQVSTLRSKSTPASSTKARQSKAVAATPKLAPPKKVIPKTQKASAKPALYRVIVGTFTKSKNAHQMVRQLKQKNVSAYVWTHRAHRKTLYRVQAGAFNQIKTARDLEKRLKAKGIDAYTMK